MIALPMMALPTQLLWYKYLPAYPQKVICRFYSEDYFEVLRSLEINLTAPKRGLN
jgi:hypothetical protein